MAKANVVEIAKSMLGKRFDDPNDFLTSLFKNADIVESQLNPVPRDSRGRLVVDKGTIIKMQMRDSSIIPGVAIGGSTIICAPAHIVQEISAIHLPMKDAEVFHVC